MLTKYWNMKCGEKKHYISSFNIYFKYVNSSNINGLAYLVKGRHDLHYLEWDQDVDYIVNKHI